MTERMTAEQFESIVGEYNEMMLYYKGMRAVIEEARLLRAERDAAQSALAAARRAIIHVRAMNPKSTLEHGQNVLLEALARIDALAAQEPSIRQRAEAAGIPETRERIP
jgi:rRNA-processing protein FCF1